MTRRYPISNEKSRLNTLFLNFPRFTCHVKSALESCPGDTLLPVFSTHPALIAFPSLYPVEPSLRPLPRTLVSIPDVHRRALRSLSLLPAVSGGLQVLQRGCVSEPCSTFGKPLSLYTVLSQTPYSPEEGLEGKKTWDHGDERKPCLAPFAIIVTVTVAIAGTDKCTLLDSFSVPVPYPGWSNNKPVFPLK